MTALFIKIKSRLLAYIDSEGLKPGDQVPSENQLALQHSVSRMTARKALTELVNEGILGRSQGQGTFVSDLRPMSSMLTIKSIHEEITSRGQHYSNQVLVHNVLIANSEQAAWLGLAKGAQVFHSIILHFENEQPVQLEDRLVNPQWAPDYLQQDFTVESTNKYLSRVAPLTQADSSAEAVCVEERIAQQLSISLAQPCLKVSRRTSSAKGIVSYALLYHPGNRYRLGGHLEFSQ